ncbi:MAG: FtsX-like permease family protein [Treponema sp.]|nr:MAG: FtsX-like permease family protein [Treponema sp.]
MCRKSQDLCITPFYESQGLVVGARNRQSAAVIRAVDPEIREIDSGFGSQVRIVSGKFNLDYPDGIVLGKSLANQLGVTVGSTVNLMALSGGKDVALLSRNRKFTVTGLFDCNFVDIEQSYGFVSLKSAEKYFGKDSSPVYSIKLKNYENDAAVLSEIERKFPDVKVQSWREFNKSFFGALRIEKNILMLLVCIIFLVVGINIYNGMRRLVFERRQEISVLSALGGTKSEIKSIFVMRGFTSGAAGSFIGLALGLLLCVNIKPVFEFMGFVTKNYMFTVFAQIPAKIIFREVFLITLFGIISPLLASWKASKIVLDTKVAEVLHDE